MKILKYALAIAVISSKGLGPGTVIQRPPKEIANDLVNIHRVERIISEELPEETTTTNEYGLSNNHIRNLKKNTQTNFENPYKSPIKIYKKAENNENTQLMKSPTRVKFNYNSNDLPYESPHKQGNNNSHFQNVNSIPKKIITLKSPSKNNYIPQANNEYYSNEVIHRPIKIEDANHHKRESLSIKKSPIKLIRITSKKP